MEKNNNYWDLFCTVSELALVKTKVEYIKSNFIVYTSEIEPNFEPVIKVLTFNTFEEASIAQSQESNSVLLGIENIHLFKEYIKELETKKWTKCSYYSAKTSKRL